MANTENIEAKLCAYIDGELDAQGRAEIEKHLAANPQHRGLIAELSKQREMLRALPREMAPEEIIEVLQGQLERAGLLGDDSAGEADVRAMRINRWPQVMAAAAIVFLAVGLVGIIYFVLPRQGDGEGTYAVGRISTEPTADSGTSTTTPTIAGADETFARRDISEKREELAAVPAPSVAPSLAPSDTPPAGVAMKGAEPPAPAAPTPTELAAAPALNGDVFGARPGKGGELDASAGLGAEIKSAQERLFSADLTRQLQNKPGGIQQNSVVLFVCTADPNAANSEVTNYLVSNNIQWEDVAEGPPAPLDQSVTRDMLLSKNAPARVQSKSMTFRQATQSPDVTIEQTVTLPPVEGKKAETEAPAQDRGAAQQQEQQQAEQIAAAPATTAPAAQIDANLIQRRAGAEGQVALTNNESRRQRMIIARNMTQKQAAELNGSLLKQSYVERAVCYPTTPAVGGGAGAGAVATTQELTLEVADQKQQFPVTPDVLARSRGKEAPTTQEAASVLADKAKDATTAPALAEAEALQTQQQQSPPAASAAAGAAPEGKAFDVAVVPTTVPAADSGALGQIAADPAASRPIFAFDDQERVDVVIVLQDDVLIDAALMPNAEPNAAATAPAPPTSETQPAEPPAAQEQVQQLPATEPPVVDSPAP